jgi:DNA-binding winged helix-turn-helix (wHTH) protein/Tol biopolymer transport system component
MTMARSATISPLARPVGLYQFGPFRLDVARAELSRNGESIPLTGKAFETLLALVERRSRLVLKDELIKLIWPDAFVTDDSLAQLISVVRRALDDDPSRPEYIATVQRRGYKFVAPVRAIGFEDGEATTSQESVTVASPSKSNRVLTSSLIAWIVVAAGGVLLAAWWTRAPAAFTKGVQGPLYFSEEPPPHTTLASAATISPNGQYLAFVAQDRESGSKQLWVQELSHPDARPLSGTDDAFRPFWSPDSRLIAFFADGKLKRTSIDDGATLTLADVGYRPSGGSWSSKDVIVYADRLSGLFKIPASGGPVTPATTLNVEAQERGHMFPRFLPDGQHFLYYIQSGNADVSGTYVGSLESDERHRVFDDSYSSVIYSPDGYLVYRRAGVILAQLFDLKTLQLNGVPTTLLAGNESSQLNVSSAATGILTLASDIARPELAWFSRKGERIGTLKAPATLANPAISPDQRLLAANGDSGDLWIVDLERSIPTPFGKGQLPIWSFDGSGITFTTRTVPGTTDMTIRPVGSKEEPTDHLLVRSREMKLAGSGSRDGRYFVYTVSDPHTRLDLWALSMTGNRKPTSFLTTGSNEMQGQISPDGQWIAYTSDESGRWEIYVQSFPVPGNKQAVSVEGGSEPQWRNDGKELFYLALDGTIVGVDMQLGPTARIGDAKRLFRSGAVLDATTVRNRYVATADGRRFLVQVAGDVHSTKIVVNWPTLLRH